MKLSDIMGHANLAIYAEIAMVLFMAVFLAVSIRIWLPGKAKDYAEAARLPLDDDPTPAAAPRRTANHG
jgi:cbb3-type cytochrome oxidase subunit 3